MKKEALETTVLKILRNREMYGYQLHKHLTAKDVKIQISNLYRLLSRMEKDKLLRSEWQKGEIGPRKKVYVLTSFGKKELNRVLKEAVETIKDFYRDYLEQFPPQQGVFNEMEKLIDDKVKDQNAVVIVHERFSGMSEWLTANLCNKLENGKVYLIKPSSIEMKLKRNNLVVLDGTYDDIPLKGNFATSLRVADIPTEVDLKSAVVEFHRILKDDGVLLIATPRVLLGEEGPLSIGSFIELVEHDSSQKIGEEYLVLLLETYFHEVKMTAIAHLKLFIACGKRLLKAVKPI